MTRRCHASHRVFIRRLLLITSVAMILCDCSVRHAPSGQAVYKIEMRNGALNLIPPSLPGGLISEPIPFSQILAKQYGYNAWEQYVDLSHGMRLAVQRLIDKAQTENAYYAIASAGRGVRIRSLSPAAGNLNRRARYMRLFYQTKFLKSAGQPVRPAVFLWSDSTDRLRARTTEARDNPGFDCREAIYDCIAFEGKTTVSPELQVVVNQQPRYVLFGSTVRDVLRTDRVSDNAEIRMLRRHGSHLVPVTWEQKVHLMSLPLVAGDEMSW